MPVQFDITFSEPIDPDTIAAADFVNSGTSAVTATLSHLSGNTNYRLTISTATAGTIILSAADGAVTDVVGNGLDETAQGDATVHYGLFVQPLYANNGAGWNDYVKNDGANFYSATDTACVGDEATYRDCFHAGEMRKVMIPGDPAACSGYSMTDSLAAFQWQCVTLSNGARAFVSRRLASGKGLRHLIKSTGDAWEEISVTLTKPDASTSSSTSAQLWSNPVEALPPNGGGSDAALILAAAGKVYTLTADADTQGYNVAADRISVVTLNNSRLRYGGSATANTNSTTGTTTAADIRTIVSGGGVRFIWIEGDFSGEWVGPDGIDRNLAFAAISHSRFKDLGLKAGGLLFTSVDALRVTGVRKVDWGSLTMTDVDGSFFQDINTSEGGFDFRQANDNVIDLAILSNRSAYLLNLWADPADVSDGTYNSNNTISRLVAVGSDGGGVSVSSAQSTFGLITLSGYKAEGIGAWENINDPKNLYHNIVFGRNSDATASLSVPQNSGVISQLALARLGHATIFIGSGSAVVAKNNIIIPTGGTCYTNESASLDNTCQGPSVSTTLVADGAIENAFVGKIVSDESVNTSDTNGSATFPANVTTFDWFGFLNPFTEAGQWMRMKVWANDGTGYPTPGAWTSGTGFIWDYALKASDTVLRNTTVTGSGQNAALTNGAACPSFLNGDAVSTDANGAAFLTHAFELPDDDVGNDNIRCETGETCLYTPNFGAYQGHGDFTAFTCDFSDGLISGVTMHYYPVNGL